MSLIYKIKIQFFGKKIKIPNISKLIEKNEKKFQTKTPKQNKTKHISEEICNNNNKKETGVEFFFNSKRLLCKTP